MAAEKGFCLWFTGLSGSGKTTITNVLVKELRRRGSKLEVLDGDIVRQNLSKGLGFSKEDRDTNIRRVAFVASLLARNDVPVITAAISPYRELRDEARAKMDGRFIEAYVKASVEECERRDVKGLYAKARAGEIKEFTGVSDPYEPPKDPDSVRDLVATLDEEAGLEGLETFYPAHTPEQTRHCLDLCEELGLAPTASSDFHGPTHKTFARFGAYDTYGLGEPVVPPRPQG